MVKEEVLSLYQDEVQTSVNVTAFMTGVTIFFTGLLITKFDSYDLSIKIPILFLLISTFGFLYSTLIYANASGEITRYNKGSRFNKNMNIGDSIGEYIGVYFLVLSIPLVINSITTDAFLRLATLIVSLMGLIVYHLSGFSIMERHYPKAHKIILLFIVILEVSLYLTQRTEYFVYISVIMILYLMTITFFSRNKYL